MTEYGKVNLDDARPNKYLTLALMHLNFACRKTLYLLLVNNNQRQFETLKPKDLGQKPRLWKSSINTHSDHILLKFQQNRRKLSKKLNFHGDLKNFDNFWIVIFGLNENRLKMSKISHDQKNREAKLFNLNTKQIL